MVAGKRASSLNAGTTIDSDFVASENTDGAGTCSQGPHRVAWPPGQAQALLLQLCQGVQGCRAAPFRARRGSQAAARRFG